MMRCFHRKTIVVLCGLLSWSLSSYALLSPNNYANYLQNLKSAINSVTSLTNQARQIQQQFHTIQNQVKNSTSISHYQWHNIQNLMQQMSETSQQQHALSYSQSNLDQQFQTVYPDYIHQRPNHNDQQIKNRWHQTTLSTLQQSLKTLKVDAADFQRENALMNQLKQQGQSSTGRLQVLQVLSEIAAENVNQLQAMKRVMMTQANAQTAYMAYRVSQDAYQQRILTVLDHRLNTQAPRYQNHAAFGLIPSMR